MLRMSIWVHSYAVIHVRMTVDFRKNRARLGLCEIFVMKWLRCSPSLNVSHMCIGCIQSILAPWCAVDEHDMGSLTVIRLCRSGVNFGVLGVDLSWYDVVMSLLRLLQASDWIPHPYWMYTKHFGTLICCVWAYGTTLTVICLCRLGVDFWGLGVDLKGCDVVMSKVRPQQS